MGGPPHLLSLQVTARGPRGGTGTFLGTISHQPLRRVRPSSEAKGPVQEKQQTVPAEWSPAPCFTTCFPSGASSWHRTKSGWFPHGSSGLGGSCFLWTGGRAHSHLAETWARGGLESCHQACLGGPRRTLNPGRGSLADRCWAARAGCGGLGRSAWGKPFPPAGPATAPCRGWPRSPARWQGFPLCSRLGRSRDIPGPFIKLRPHWGEKSARGQPQTCSPAPPFPN